MLALRNDIADRVAAQIHEKTTQDIYCGETSLGNGRTNAHLYGRIIFYLSKLYDDYPRNLWEIADELELKCKEKGYIPREGDFFKQITDLDRKEIRECISLMENK